MGIFDRMGRIISSNVNSLLDSAEDPEKTVGLVVEEMRDQLRRAKQEIVESVATEKQLAARVADLDAQAATWTKRAELALRAGDEALAREALVQKKRIVGERDQAEAQAAAERGRVEQMKRDLARMESKHRELETRKGTIAAEIRKGRAGGGAEGLGARTAGASAFDEFRRMEQAIDQAEAQAAAAREVEQALGSGAGAPLPGSMPKDELERRFAELEGRAARPGGSGDSKGGGAAARSEIDEELSALKKRIRVE
jgi:phage shock protein A